MIAVLSQTVNVNAQALEEEQTLPIETFSIKIENPIMATTSVEEAPKPVEEEKDKEVLPVEYEIKSGDYLDRIASEQKTTWLRLWQKNKNIEHPDRIYVGDKLIIPTPEETLEDRPLPVEPLAPVAIVEAPQVAPTAPVRQSTAPAPQPVRTVARGSSAGNTYGYGYCTWYVKNRRPDLPNGLGNANTWYSRAQAMGLPTGSAPRAGAVGTTTGGSLGHVVYVERVNSDGTVLISEMNYRGWNQVSSRTTAASDFLYIY